MAKSTLSNNPTQLLTKARSNMTDWINVGVNIITATTSNPTKGTAVIDRMFVRRSGPNMEVRIEYLHNAAGLAGTGDYLWSIPTAFGEYSGLQIDTTKVTPYPTITATGAHKNTLSNIVGTANIDSSAGTGAMQTNVAVYDSSKVRFIGIGYDVNATAQSAGTQSSSYFAFSNANLSVVATFCVPILGWSSTAEFLAPQISGGVNLQNISVNPQPLANGSQSLGEETKAWGALYLKDTATAQVYKVEVTNGIFQVITVP